MDDKDKRPVKVEDVPQELMDDFEDIDVDQLLPTMTVSKELVEPPEKECIVSDEKIVGLYDEILKDCREDCSKADEVLANFLDMVMNEGDASSASKEAIVNILKIKSDIADKKAKVADLWTRLKLKERDTYPRYLAAQQNNKVVIESSKREMIKSINKLTQRNKNDTSH